MTTHLRPFAVTGAALASVGALVLTTPTISASAAVAPAFGLTSASPAVALLSHDDDDDYDGGYDGDDYDDFVAYVNGNAYGFGNGNGNAYGFGNGNGNDDDRGGGFGNFIADFLANNQTEVLAVTSMIPTFYLGPVAVGNSLLATAYYNGYNGSAAGVDGVISYVTSQIGVPPAEIVQSLVLSVTSLIPQFNIGPVPVGNALLATAYFDGYNGSGTGLPGVISYVTSQLGIQAAPAAVTVNAVAAPVAAPVAVSATDSAPAVGSVAAQDSDAEAGTDDVRAVKAVDKVVATTVSPAGADADRPGSAAPVSAPAAENTRRAGRASGQLPTTAKAGDAGGQSKARSVRSAAKSGAGES